MNEKAHLLAIIAGTNRGLLASESDKIKIHSAVESLEILNPTPLPLQATSLLEGDWRLLYTTSRGLLGFDKFPLIKLGAIYQAIRIQGSKIYNIAELAGVPLVEGIVSVTANFYPLSERRVKVNFERSIIAFQRVINYQSPSQFIQAIENNNKFPPLDFSIANREQKGWLDVTYLDEDLRIGRGNEGSVFVLTKN